MGDHALTPSEYRGATRSANTWGERRSLATGGAVKTRGAHALPRLHQQLSLREQRELMLIKMTAEPNGGCYKLTYVISKRERPLLFANEK